YWKSLDSATIPSEGTDESVRLLSNNSTIFGEVRHFLSDEDFMTFRAGVFNSFFETSHLESDPEKRRSQSNSINSMLQFNITLAENLLLTTGADFRYNYVESIIYGGESWQSIVAAYAQAEAKYFDALNLTLGARVDQEQTGEYTGDTDYPDHLEISPKFGANYGLPFGMMLRASVGKGFRAASIAEKFSAVQFQGFEVVPNPDLAPEQSWSYEIGASYEFTNAGFPIELDISIFRNELINLIEPSILNQTQGSIRFENVTRARVSGVEFTARTFLFKTLGFETGITYMDPRDLTNNEILKYRSELLWYSRLLLPLGAVELQADYRYKSEFKNIDEELKFQVRDYDARVPVHVVDVRASLDLGKMTEYPLKLTLNAENLLDYYYVNMVGNLAQTRHISLQMEMDF
ncbi:MAG: TonB-dependent receptor plug domain-containing protein, partial [Bacteroidota bacterium]